MLSSLAEDQPHVLRDCYWAPAAISTVLQLPFFIRNIKSPTTKYANDIRKEQEYREVLEMDAG